MGTFPDTTLPGDAERVRAEVARLVQVRDQRRSALTRALALQDQLDEKARELNRAAAAEHAEARQRLCALDRGTSRVCARHSALERSLALVRSQVNAVSHRRKQLLQLCTARRMRIEAGAVPPQPLRIPRRPLERPGLSPLASGDDGSDRELLCCSKVDASDGQIIMDALTAFSEGVIDIFITHFERPIVARVGEQDLRLQRLIQATKTAAQVEWKQLPNGGDDSPAMTLSSATAVLSEGELLLCRYTDSLEQALASVRDSSRGIAPTGAAIRQQLLELHAAVGRWRLRQQRGAAKGDLFCQSPPHPVGQGELCAWATAPLEADELRLPILTARSV